MQCRIAHGFNIDDFGVGIYRFFKILVAGWVDKGGENPHLRQQFIQQGMGAAVNRITGNDVIALSTQLEQRA